MGMKPDHQIALYVSYSQLSVFLAGVENPFNGWSDEQVKQGFTWSRESVSFKTIYQNGDAIVNVFIKNKFIPDPKSQGTISVSFEVPRGRMVEIATITQGRLIEIASGKYILCFETYIGEENEMVCNLTFLKKGKVT